MLPFLKKLILLRWVFIVACRLFLVAVSRGYSPAVVCGLLMVALRSQGNWRWEGPLGTEIALYGYLLI